MSESVMERFEEWAHLRHPNQHANAQETPQESRMTRISDAKAAIDQAAQQLASLTGNALAEAIADAGVGLTFTPGDVGLVLAMIRAIEHGPGLGTVAQTVTPAVSFSAAPVPAAQLQPQQTA